MQQCGSRSRLLHLSPVSRTILLATGNECQNLSAPVSIVTAVHAGKYYGVSDTAVDMLSIIYMMLYIPGTYFGRQIHDLKHLIMLLCSLTSLRMHLVRSPKITSV